MLSINLRALAIVREMIEDAESLDVAVSTLENGTVVVDAGIGVRGSLEAGRLFARVCLGGLASVDFCQLPFGDVLLPGVTVAVSHPVVACMASQYAGWAVKADGFFAMASGPARALYAGEPLFAHLPYRDRSEVAVLALEGRDLPTVEAAGKVARKCGVSPDHLYMLIAPTASLAGSVQVAARVVETGLHKMHEVGFDIHSVVAGIGTCPLASVARKDLQAIGRTNDAVLYGGRAWYTVQAEDARIEEVIDRLPSCSSRDHGTLFYDLFKRYDGDFYKIDPMLFSPAEVCINNLASGRTFRAGAVAPELIRASILVP
jgi:methenyltetrahydromethanopterin cyclohydrolase